MLPDGVVGVIQPELIAGAGQTSREVNLLNDISGSEGGVGSRGANGRSAQ